MSMNFARNKTQRQIAARSCAIGRDAGFILANSLQFGEGATTKLPFPSSRWHLRHAACGASEESHRPSTLGKARSVRALTAGTRDAVTSDDGQESECCERRDAQEQPLRVNPAALPVGSPTGRAWPRQAAEFETAWAPACAE